MFKSIFKTTVDNTVTKIKELVINISSLSFSYVSNQEDMYDITYVDNIDGNIRLFLEYNQVKGYISIKNILKPSTELILNKICKIGDILISINDHLVIDEDFSDILTFFEMLKAGSLSIRLSFLNTTKCSFSTFMESSVIAHRNKKDMYGFNRTLDYLLTERNYIAINGNLHTQRDLEWIDYLKAIGGPSNIKPAGIYKPNDELKLMVRRGIPVAFRSLLWQKISLSSYHRLEFPKDYYNSLLLRENELDRHVRDDIEKDIDRTFPEHEYFSGCGNGETCLRRILIAFALHNPSIGYCQSLNFVSGMMLLFMEEEDAFWLLLTVVETLLPKDYYTRTMIGTYTDQYVLNHLVKEHFPKLYELIEQSQLQLPLLTVQWFMCIFVNTLRPEIALRVWDMFLNEGSKVLFRIAISLFKLNEALLLSSKDSGELFIRLRDIGRDIVDPDLLISTAYKSFKPSIVKRNSLDVPHDLTGLGLAHTGPMKMNSVVENNNNNNNIENVLNTTIESMIRNNLISGEFTDDESNSVSVDGSTNISKNASIDETNIIVTESKNASIDETNIIVTESNNDSIDESNNVITENSTKETTEDISEPQLYIVTNNDSTKSSERPYSIEKLRIKSLKRIIKEDGTDYNILISDSSKPKTININNNNSIKDNKQLNNIINDNYRKFKRNDIALWREKYRIEVSQLVNDLENNRKIWKEEQSKKQKNNTVDNNNNINTNEMISIESL